MSTRILLAVGLTWLSLLNTAVAAPPLIVGVTPRGLKPGANEVTVQGANFTPQLQAVLDIPGAAVVIKAGTTPTVNQLVWTVTLPPETPIGAYELRVATTDGLSLPAPITVDAFTTVAEVEPNDQFAQAQAVAIPCAVDARLNSVESDLFAFEGQAGQRFVAEIAARRLGANVKPVLRLIGPDHLLLQSARPQRRLGDDARLEVVLPKSGRYVLQVQDLLYRGDNGQYRLFLGDAMALARATVPLGGKSDDKLPAPSVIFGDRPVTGAQIPAAMAPEFRGILAVTAPATLSLPLPQPFGVGTSAEVLEVARTDAKPQPVAIPATVTGRLDTSDEIDSYSIAVTPGLKLHIAVESERLGTLLDPVVDIKNDQGAVLLTQDDGPLTADSDFVYTVPAGATTLTLTIRDILRQFGPSCAYRLTVEPAPEGEFDLRVEPSLVNIPAGGSALLRVRATRREAAGAIRLVLSGDLPPGLVVTGAEIGPGATETLLSLSLPEKVEPRFGVVRLFGQIGPTDKPVITRAATVAPTPAHLGLPWVQYRLGLGTAQPLPLSLLVEDATPLLRGVEHSVKVRVRRAAEQTGPIRLIVQQSIAPPGQGQPAFVANQTIPENMTEAVVKFTVPQNSAEYPFTYAITGELLDAKTKQAVVARADSASVATSIVFPFQVELTVPPELQRGVRHVLAGKLTRVAPFNEPIQLALLGLPGNIRTAPITVPAGANEFSIPLLISPLYTPAPIANVQLTGTWASTPPLAMKPQILPLVVAKADPPNALEILGDGADFSLSLSDGAGTVVLDEAMFFSGKQSVQVKAGPKTKASIPGLGVQIVENPAPGQYRFIRFAWKKQGGTSLSLQLGNNGVLGNNNAKGTEYRYVAGADTGKAIRVADAVPAEWTVVTRDLFADHGAFNLTGLGLVPTDGDAAWFDHIYLGRTEADLPAK